MSMPTATTMSITPIITILCSPDCTVTRMPTSQHGIHIHMCRTSITGIGIEVVPHLHERRQK